MIIGTWADVTRELLALELGCSRSSSASAATGGSLNGGTTVMTLVLAGARFNDGILVQEQPREEVQAA